MSERLLLDCRKPGMRGKALRAYIAMGTSESKKDRSVPELLEKFKGYNKQEKLVASINLLGKIFPGTESIIKSRICDFGELPISNVDTNVNFGNGENVIFVHNDGNSKDPDFVVRVNKAMIGCSANEIESYAHIANREYEIITNWFKDTELIIPKEHIIIGHSHVKNPKDALKTSKKDYNIPTMIILQEYVPGTNQGIFENYSFDTFKEEFAGNETILKQWGKISKRIVDIYDNQGITPDIIGENNFSINRRDNGEIKLLHIDPHMIQTRRHVREWNLECEYLKRLDFLRRCAKEL